MFGDEVPQIKRIVGVQLSADSLVPVVILKAMGQQVGHVVNQARENDIPVIESKSLSASLYRIPIDNAVTPDLFPLMAALLAHVIQVDRVVSGKAESK